MSDYHINVFYSEEDAAYVADIPDLEACSFASRSRWVTRSARSGTE